MTFIPWQPWLIYFLMLNFQRYIIMHLLELMVFRKDYMFHQMLYFSWRSAITGPMRIKILITRLNRLKV